MDNKKIKIIIFLILVIILIIIFLKFVLGINFFEIKVSDIKNKRKLKEDLVTQFNINGMPTVYDKVNNVFYFSINKKENSLISLKLSIDDYKYKIIGYRTSLIKVRYNKPYKIIIYNEKNYFETQIMFTKLPLISISVEDDIDKNDVDAKLLYTNSENSNESNIKIHIRGASSSTYDKKSYKVKVYNSDYSDTKKISLSSFNKSDSFILDANFRDMSKIRYTIAYSIWNDISDDFTDINTNFEYVEVFVNSEYKGIYILFEPIKRSTLNLTKSTDKDTSIIIKGIDYKHNISESKIKNINFDEYLNFEMKYPNNKEYYSESWEKILSILSDYYNLDKNKTDKIVNNTFNIKNYVDLLLFNTFLNNNDNNIEKNNYFYMKSINDNLVYLQPWDMEFSMGLHWCTQCKYNNTKLDDYEDINVKFDIQNMPETVKLVIKRYKELRKNVLTEDNFNNMIDEYKKNILFSGKRDSQIWYEYDIEEEIEFVRNWLIKRLDVFDKYVGELENEL